MQALTSLRDHSLRICVDTGNNKSVCRLADDNTLDIFETRIHERSTSCIQKSGTFGCGEERMNIDQYYMDLKISYLTDQSTG